MVSHLLINFYKLVISHEFVNSYKLIILFDLVIFYKVSRFLQLSSFLQVSNFLLAYKFLLAQIYLFSSNNLSIVAARVALSFFPTKPPRTFPSEFTKNVVGIAVILTRLSSVVGFGIIFV